MIMNVNVKLDNGTVEVIVIPKSCYTRLESYVDAVYDWLHEEEDREYDEILAFGNRYHYIIINYLTCMYDLEIFDAYDYNLLRSHYCERISVMTERKIDEI